MAYVSGNKKGIIKYYLVNRWNFFACWKLLAVLICIFLECQLLGGTSRQGTSAPSGVLHATYYLSDLQRRVSQYFHVIQFLLLHVLSDSV